MIRAVAAVCTAVLVAGSPADAATDRPSIRAEVMYGTKDQLRAVLASGLDVTHAHGATLDILVTPEQLASLQAQGLGVRILDEDVYAPDGGGLRGGTWLPEYMSYTEAAAALAGFASAYPALTELTSIGSSTEGRAIWALKISDAADIDESEPEVLIVGNHHAREQITQILCVEIAENLLTNYGSDPEFTQWVDEREIWIVPVLNPDGLTWVETNDLFWRKNRWVDPQTLIKYGVDLNRNYAYEWGHDSNGSSGQKSSETYRGPSAASEPEIQAIQNFVNAREFAFTISYHSYGNLTLWGPGYKPGIPVDQDLFSRFGQIVNLQNGYSPGNPAMGNIYITNGDMDDWVYYSPAHSRAYALTAEVGNSNDYFNPPAARIPALVVEGSVLAWTAIEHADRPERLAPPGQPSWPVPLVVVPTGDYTVSWNGPVAADTQVALYELTEKQGPAVVTDGAESGSGRWNLGGWSLSGARKFSGAFSFYSGSADNLNRILLAKEGYAVHHGDVFSFRAWYDIETNWDYAYAILSADGGRSFVNLPGTGTTMNDPNGNNADHGITGTSAGWQLHTYDLTPWAGQTVWLGLRYFTDGGVSDEGFYADDLHPVQTWTTATVLSSTITGTSFPITGRPQGYYSYAVRGRDAEGDWGYPSADQDVAVDPPTLVEVAAAPAAFSLSAGSPNPFRGVTAIRFALPAPGEHSLVVFDVAGRQVRSLSSGATEAGAHLVRWDGRNDEGRLVPSGVYFYRLRAESGERRARVVVRR
jgi:hypothetical protein